MTRFAVTACVLLAALAFSRAGGAAEPLVPTDEIRALQVSQPWQCDNWDPDSRTCETVAHTEWVTKETGVRTEYVMLNANPPVFGIVMGPVAAEDALFCTGLSSAQINIVSPVAIEDEARDTFSRLLTDALRSLGDELCWGLRRQSGHFVGVDYIDGKQRSGPATTIRFFDDEPDLRTVN